MPDSKQSVSVIRKPTFHAVKETNGAYFENRKKHVNSYNVWANCDYVTAHGI